MKPNIDPALQHLTRCTALERLKGPRRPPRKKVSDAELQRRHIERRALELNAQERREFHDQMYNSPVEVKPPDPDEFVFVGGIRDGQIHRVTEEELLHHAVSTVIPPGPVYEHPAAVPNACTRVEHYRLDMISIHLPTGYVQRVRYFREYNTHNGSPAAMNALRIFAWAQFSMERYSRARETEEAFYARRARARSRGPIGDWTDGIVR